MIITTDVTADTVAFRRNYMFGKRLASGVVLMIAAILLFVAGGYWLLAAVGILSLIGVYEMLRVLGMEKYPLSVPAYLAVIVYGVLLGSGLEQWLMAVPVVTLIVMLVIYVLQYPGYKIEKVAEAFFSFVYVGVMLFCLYQTRALPGGQWLVWMILIASWGSDTCAYLTGILIGKHHFSELSPKKTIEGCIGGIAGAGLLGFGYAFFFPYKDLFLWTPVLVFPVIAMIGAVISQFGDLAASAVKRNYEIKDYGTLIPGHGGILDRFDSVIFVAPFVYYLIRMTMWIQM